MPFPSKAMTWVTVFSKNSRSWLTKNSVPLQSCNKLSSSSSVSISKSFVGSSKTKTLVGRANNRANNKRLRSPPERDLTGERERCGGNKKSSRQLMTCLRSVPISTKSEPGLMVSASVASSSNCSRIWSKQAMFKFVPRSILPLSGSTSPKINLSNVLLPMPFGPNKPIRSPRKIRVLKSLMSVLSP